MGAIINLSSEYEANKKNIEELKEKIRGSIRTNKKRLHRQLRASFDVINGKEEFDLSDSFTDSKNHPGVHYKLVQVDDEFDETTVLAVVLDKYNDAVDMPAQKAIIGIFVIEGSIVMYLQGGGVITLKPNESYTVPEGQKFKIQARDKNTKIFITYHPHLQIDEEV